MKLTNEVQLLMPVDRAWQMLTDIPRIAPLLPGARLVSVDGDVYTGELRVKVGPIQAHYEGTGQIRELDLSARRMVIVAEGREKKGQGGANAVIAVELAPAGNRTHVRIETDLNVLGRLGQFGRGILSDVSAEMLKQFAHGLETQDTADLSPQPAPSPESRVAGGTEDRAVADRPSRAGVPPPTDPETAEAVVARDEAGPVTSTFDHDDGASMSLSFLWPILVKRAKPALVVTAVVLAFVAGRCSR